MSRRAPQVVRMGRVPNPGGNTSARTRKARSLDPKKRGEGRWVVKGGTIPGGTVSRFPKDPPPPVEGTEYVT